jgi:hypothetical protein
MYTRAVKISSNRSLTLHYGVLVIAFTVFFIVLRNGVPVGGGGGGLRGQNKVWFSLLM